MPDAQGRPTRSDISDAVMLRAVVRAEQDGVRVTTHLSGTWPAKVVEAKVRRLIERGLLECGVTPLRPWLTQRGYAFLKEHE
jgi:hypothetical protein